MPPSALRSGPWLPLWGSYCADAKLRWRARRPTRKKGAAPGLRSRSLRFYGVCKGLLGLPCNGHDSLAVHGELQARLGVSAGAERIHPLPHLRPPPLRAAQVRRVPCELEAYTARAEKLVSTMKQFDEVFDALISPSLTCPDALTMWQS